MHLIEKIVKLEHEAADFGFAWEKASQVIEQIQSECDEVKAHLQQDSLEHKAALKEEIGDLMHAVFSLCVFCELDATETLSQALEKFERRFNTVKSMAKARGLTNLKNYAFDELMDFWSEAKNKVG